MKTVFTLLMVVLISMTGIASQRLFVFSHWSVSAFLTLVVVGSIILCIDLLTNPDETLEKYSLH